MCSNYFLPLRFHEHFDHLDATFEYRAECYPGYESVALLNENDQLTPVRAVFGMLPHWAKDEKLARSTYNARSETVAEKPSFQNAWRKRQFCLIPVQTFYEPNWETGKAVRWGIHRKDGQPFCLAGIWETRTLEDGRMQRSMAMLTINATDHPLMSRFHRPADEKRSVVVIDPADYNAWLAATHEEARAFLRPIDVEQFTASPLPPEKQQNRT